MGVSKADVEQLSRHMQCLGLPGRMKNNCRWPEQFPYSPHSMGGTAQRMFCMVGAEGVETSSIYLLQRRNDFGGYTSLRHLTPLRSHTLSYQQEV